MADPKDPIEQQGALFKATMQKAMRTVTPKLSDRVTEMAAELAQLTGLSAATFVGLMIQMHSKVWGDFCDAVGEAYIAAAIGVTEEHRCASCGAAILEQEKPCPKCRSLPS